MVSVAVVGSSFGGIGLAARLRQPGVTDLAAVRTASERSSSC